MLTFFISSSPLVSANISKIIATLPAIEKPEPYQSPEEVFKILSLASIKGKGKRYVPQLNLKPYRPTIVIDAGHGGKDPGSISAKGTFEKDVTLKATKVLFKELRKTLRYNIILTRQKDVFVPKRERFAIARNAKADFLISIHADSHPSKKMRGLTIYTLSEKASDKEALRLSKQENKSDYFEGLTLANVSKNEVGGLFSVFVDLAQRGSSNTALTLAKSLHHQLKQNKIGKLMALRSADLAVLKAPEVPSILIELGYLSNAKDEKLIQSVRYQKQLASSLIKALDNYFTKS